MRIVRWKNYPPLEKSLDFDANWILFLNKVDTNQSLKKPKVHRGHNLDWTLFAEVLVEVSA